MPLAGCGPHNVQVFTAIVVALLEEFTLKTLKVIQPAMFFTEQKQRVSKSKTDNVGRSSAL